MRILITGNMGYVGPAVARQLRATFPKADIIGFDTGYFAHCLSGSRTLPELVLNAQYFGDVRNIPESIVEGCDAVVQLAAISNDPMGDAYADVTRSINQDSSLALAHMAARAGVRNYVFASSCSVYGVAQGPARRESDELNPITAYARSKIGTEQGLAELNSGMTVTCLRFATACGMSDRLRLDLVLNDFVAGALSTGKVTVLSDGSPWRPLIDTTDMARAIEWAIMREPASEGRYLAINAGRDEANYQVSQLANAVAETLPGTEVSINLEAPADSRSYQVDFALYRRLAPQHQPKKSLHDSISELVTGLRSVGFSNSDYRNSQMIRLQVLARHRAEGRLDEGLYWKDAA